MIKICISGFLGKMGNSIKEQIESRSDCVVSTGVDYCADESKPSVVVSDFTKLTEKPDVIIDFSSAVGTQKVITYCTEKLVPCVICTTGLDETVTAQLKELSLLVPVFTSANMSLGINLLIELAKIATSVLGDSFDIEIIEKHHHRKLDAPSGTALMIADAINESENNKYNYVYDRHDYRKPRDKNEMGIHAIRGGTIVGDHEVIFAGTDEVLSLSHSAASRDVFANGAINAAVYIKDKPAGSYNMKDLINQII